MQTNRMQLFRSTLAPRPSIQPDVRVLLCLRAQACSQSTQLSSKSCPESCVLHAKLAAYLKGNSD